MTMIRVRHYRSRDRYEYFMYTQFFPSSHYPTDFSSLPIFSIYFAYLFDRQNRIISRLMIHFTPSYCQARDRIITRLRVNEKSRR